MTPLIRQLDPKADLPLVAKLYDEAADYWLLGDRTAHGPQKVAEFFTDGPPDCDPALSYRLGLFVEGHLAGVAELYFGFPTPQDAYLGLMLFSGKARGLGLGKALLSHIETLAKGRGAARLYLGVLAENPRGRAFWEREGFGDTGLSRVDDETGHRLSRLGKALG